MAKFTVAPGLEARIAKMIVPRVDEIGEAVTRIAKEKAPPTKKWRSMGDERVRPEHRRVNGQTVPMNLRFTLKSHPWDMKRRGLGEFTYMLWPKDETSRAVVNIINCRCRDLSGGPVIDPNGVAELVKWSGAKAHGKTVSGAVVAEGNLVVQAERGDVYPGGLVSGGTWFMATAAAEAKYRMRLS